MNLRTHMTHRAGAALLTGLTLAATGPAWGQAGPETEDLVAPGVDNPAGESVEAAVEGDFGPGDRVSGNVGVSYNSHFISYGLDVWGGGDDFFGSESTTFVYADVSLDFSPVTVTFGVWSDINDNVESEIGGEIQEIDVFAGVAYSIDRFTVGATYQEWYYASDEERIVDIAVEFDDTGLLFEDFALNPSFLAHLRVDGNGGQEESEAFVIGIAPEFNIIDSEDYPVTLAIPVSVAFFTDEFQGGDSGFGYVSVGAAASVPLAFIPEEFGAWSLNADVTYYHTEDDAIPGNPEDDFFTGAIGLNLAF